VKKKLLGTGRPPRRKRVTPTKINLASLGPLDGQQRYSRAEAAAYLKTSLPTIHKLINAYDKDDPTSGLEAFKKGSRTYISGRSIAAQSLPPT
jgi:hypothetical protein